MGLGFRVSGKPRAWACKDLEDNHKGLHFEVTGAAGLDWISDAEGTSAQTTYRLGPR